MDDKALVAGTSVFFPVYIPGALFEVGDDTPLRAMAKST
jgi:acetamidase/formamidase